MDEARLIRAAEITVRRAVLRNFPPGREREKRLAWLARVVCTQSRTTQRSCASNSVILHRIKKHRSTLMA